MKAMLDGLQDNGGNDIRPPAPPRIPDPPMIEGGGWLGSFIIAVVVLVVVLWPLAKADEWLVRP